MPDVVVVDWDAKEGDRPMIAGWSPKPFDRMSKETRDAIQASIPEFTFDEPYKIKPPR